MPFGKNHAAPSLQQCRQTGGGTKKGDDYSFFGLKILADNKRPHESSNIGRIPYRPLDLAT